MFELIADGTVEKITQTLKQHGIRFGFGGFARVGHGMLPAEMILTEHYALGSSMAILSRGFCDANVVENPKDIAEVFEIGVHDIRRKEEEVVQYTAKQFEDNHNSLVGKVHEIVQEIRARKSK